MKDSTESPISHTGKFALQDGSKVEFILNTDGMTAPTTLTFTAFNLDGSPKNSLKTDTTLYFNTEGKITGRVPLNSHTNVRILKDLYANPLHAVLDINALKLVVGFFLPGEFGIQRQRDISEGEIRRVFSNEIL